MHVGGTYNVTLVGTKKPVKFTVERKVADGTEHMVCGNRRRAEVAFTKKGAIVGRKLLVCCEKRTGNTRKEEFKQFKTLAEAAKWFSVKFPEEASVIKQIKAFVPPPPSAEEI